MDREVAAANRVVDPRRGPLVDILLPDLENLARNGSYRVVRCVSGSEDPPVFFRGFPAAEERFALRAEVLGDVAGG